MDDDAQREQEEREEVEREAGTALLAWHENRVAQRRRLHEALEAGLAAREEERKENENDDE